MLGFEVLSTTLSYTSEVSLPLGGGVIIPCRPAAYSPTRTRARYIQRSPFASTGEYRNCAEWEASLAKYTPFPQKVAEKRFYHSLISNRPSSRYPFLKILFSKILPIKHCFFWGDRVSPKRNRKQWLCKSLEGQQRVIYNNYLPQWR